jgi:hypothetical protein
MIPAGDVLLDSCSVNDFVANVALDLHAIEIALQLSIAIPTGLGALLSYF